MAAGARRLRPGGAGLQGAGRRPLQAHPAQLRELQAILDARPAAWGWHEDQCWTLARIAQLVRCRFGVDYTLAGLDLLLHRIGWSMQVPARQAAERDEAHHQVEGGDLAVDKSTAADLGAWLCFEDESGQGLRPPKGRTWAAAAIPPAISCPASR